MNLETLNVRPEGAALFVEIAAPPMNLLGPELVRDLDPPLNQACRSRRRIQSAGVQKRRPRLLHLSCRPDPNP